MPFWLHEHKFVCACKGQSLWCKLITIGLVVGALGLGWFIGIFTPQQWMLHQKQCLYTTLLAQKKTFLSTINQNQCYCDRYEQLKKQYITLAHGRSLQQVTNNLFVLMHQNKLSCNAIERGQIIDKGHYLRHRLIFSCKGAFHNILTLLEMIDKNEQPVECKSIIMSKKKNRSLSCKLHVSMISAKEGNSS